MTIKNISDISTATINNLDTDYKAEVVAASLIEQGFDPELIMIVRDGIARRGFSKEVEDIYEQFSTQVLMDYLYIKANKEGLYDMLPQGLFHQPVYKKSFIKDREEALSEIRIHREEEFFARKFFQLFENMADQLLVEASLYESYYDRNVRYPDFVGLFEVYWPELKMLEHRQAVFFMHIIPILHKIRINRTLVAEAISYILDVPIMITEVKLPAKKADRYFESRLGESRLGVDMVLGSSFDDGEYDLKITVGPIPAKKMLNFLETAPGYRLLDNLCELFLPVDRFIVKEFKILPEESAFILSDENHTTYLGINSFI